MSIFLVFLHLNSFAQGSYSIFENQGKYGLKDGEGKELIRARFDKIGWSAGLNIPMNDVIGYYDDAWGLVSLKDRNITAPKYYSLEAIHKGLILASVIGRFSNELLYGTINSRGETVVGFKYHSISKVKDLLIVSERRQGQSFYGLYTELNVELLPLKYKSIRPFNNELFVFENESGKKGIIHQNGQKLVEASLDSIGPIVNGRCRVRKEGKIGVLDSLGIFLKRPIYKSVAGDLSSIDFSKIEIRTNGNHEVQTFEADSVQAMGTPYHVVFYNGYARISDQHGDEIASIDQLKKIEVYRDNLILYSPDKIKIVSKEGKSLSASAFDEVRRDEHYLYVKEKNQWTIYNSFGRKLSNRLYQDVLEESNNLIPVQKKKYWGYLDHSGDRAISFKYDAVSGFKGRMATVKYLGYNMLINQFGEQLGEPAYDSVRLISDELALVTIKGRTDLLNSQGAAIFQTYNQLEDHPLGFLEKTEDGDVGLVSMQGKIIFDPIYTSISDPMNNKYLIVKTTKKVGLTLLDGSSLLAMTEEYEDILGLKEGLIGIKKDGKWGFVNWKNQLLIANRYDSIGLFQEGTGAVFLSRSWGFINKKEKLVIQPNFEEVSNFENGIAIVKRNGLFGAIDSKGHTIINTEYSALTRLKNGNLLVQKDDKVGIFNEHGEQLIPAAFSDIEVTDDHHYIVCRRNLAGVMNAHGQYVIPLKYSEIKPLKKGQYACMISPVPVDN